MGLSQSADDEQNEGDDEAAGADPMIEVPAALLRLPITGEIVRGPELDAVVDGNGADEREEDGEDLNGEGGGGEAAGEHTQVFEGQQQEEVQEGGGNHPEGHDASEEPGEGGADGDVDVERLAIERGVTEGRDIQLAAAHQAQDHDSEYLKNHRRFDVVPWRQSHNFFT